MDKIMKHLNKIEQYIKKELKNTMKELNLKSIPIYFNSIGRICFRSYPNKDFKSIHIDYLRLLYMCTQKDKNPILYDRYKLNSVHKRLKHILYHEIGHYIQARKYPLWLKKFKQIKLNNYQQESMYHPKRIVRQKAYRDLKIENNADKLAICIYERKKI